MILSLLPRYELWTIVDNLTIQREYNLQFLEFYITISNIDTHFIWNFYRFCLDYCKKHWFNYFCIDCAISFFFEFPKCMLYMTADIRDIRFEYLTLLLCGIAWDKVFCVLIFETFFILDLNEGYLLPRGEFYSWIHILYSLSCNKE